MKSYEVERYGERAGVPLPAFMRRLDWWRGEVAHRLTRSADRVVIVEVTAVAICESDTLRSRPLGDLFPGLLDVAALDSQPSYAGGLAVRATRMLESNRADNWSTIAERSAAEMFAWRNCGSRTVEEILGGVIDAWVEWGWADPVGRSGWRRYSRWESWPNERSPSSAGSGQTSATARERAAWLGATASFRTLCKAAYALGATNVGEAMVFAAGDLASSGKLARTWNQFCEVSLEELLDTECRTEPAWELLLEFREREMRILEARCVLQPARSTHAALGRELDISPARIGQIEQRCRKTIVERLSEDTCAPIVHLAARLRRQMGTLVPAAAMNDALDALITLDAPDGLLRRAIVLEQAGPYRLEDGFWQTGRPLAQIRAALSSDAHTRRSYAELNRLMHDAGVIGVHQQACRAILAPDGPTDH